MSQEDENAALKAGEVVRLKGTSDQNNPSLVIDRVNADTVAVVYWKDGVIQEKTLRPETLERVPKPKPGLRRVYPR
jgi:hypothetical protein